MSVVSKILVVDDNEEFCQNMTDILELRGYQVTTASDGLKALELVKQDGFILVLLDIKLPDFPCDPTD
jgi:CheY-like chemotaxis protein